MENREGDCSSVSAHLFVSGQVQGVGFRDFTWKNAVALCLFGTVRNLADGRVALEVEGEQTKIEELIRRLWQGPPLSEVSDISVSWKEASSQSNRFSIAY